MFVLVAHFVSLWIVLSRSRSRACVCGVRCVHASAAHASVPPSVVVRVENGAQCRLAATGDELGNARCVASPLSLALLRRARCLRWWGLCFVVNTTYTSWDMLYVSGFSDCCMQWQHMRRVRCQRRLRFLFVMVACLRFASTSS